MKYVYQIRIHIKNYIYSNIWLFVLYIHVILEGAAANVGVELQKQ